MLSGSLYSGVQRAAFATGTPDEVVNAIPGRARAHCELRYVIVPMSTTSFRRRAGILAGVPLLLRRRARTCRIA